MKLNKEFEEQSLVTRQLKEEFENKIKDMQNIILKKQTELVEKNKQCQMIKE